MTRRVREMGALRVEVSVGVGGDVGEGRYRGQYVFPMRTTSCVKKL